MNVSLMLFYFADYAIILPAAIMCMLPVLHVGRIRAGVLLPAASAVILACAFLLALARAAFHLSANTPLFVFLVPALAAYFLLFRAGKAKLWYIFLSSIAAFSFGGLSTYFVEAMLPDGERTLLLAMAVKLGLSLAFLAAELVFLKRLRWLFDNENITAVWRFVWLVPFSVAFANVMMIPVNDAYVRLGRFFQLYIVVELILLMFFVVFFIMQYAMARAITNRAEAEQSARILSLQAAQYEKLKSYLESTARLRHDFIYMAKTARMLAANGETEALSKLLSDYGANIDASAAPRRFCEHTALNAVTAYYAEQAREKDISFTARLNIGRDITVSDYELCSVVSNILDNAVAAAGEVTGRPAEIRFAADTKPNGDLYIAVSNSYSGAIRKKGKKFASAKGEGHGIGLDSVRAIAAHNRGCCNFRYDGADFYSEVMLRQG